VGAASTWVPAPKRLLFWRLVLAEGLWQADNATKRASPERIKVLDFMIYAESEWYLS